LTEVPPHSGVVDPIDNPAMLDSGLLSEYVNGFYGYGDLAGRYWFIGMEEGGGNSADEIRRRLLAWKRLGSTTTLDLAEFHREIGETRWFGSTAKLQRTWATLIRVLFAARGVESGAPGNEAVRQFQSSSLARKDSDTALLELFPLPSPSTSHWIYGELTTLRELSSRSTYYESLATKRVTTLRHLIQLHLPNVVVCYGFGHLERWHRLIPTQMKLSRIGGSSAWFGSAGGTTYAIVPHPVAHGLTTKYWQLVGERLRSILLQSGKTI
jgi:hypothetical protein